MILQLQIYLAIGAIITSIAITYRHALHRSGRYAVIDIGLWWLAFLALYSIQPILIWLFTGQFESAATDRLEVLATTEADVAQILTLSAFYAIAFMVAYAITVRSSGARKPVPIANIDNIVFVVTAILFVTLWILLKTVFPDLNTGSGYESKFLTLSESSLGLRRTHKLFLTFLVPCGIILVVGIMQRRGVRPLAILSIPALVLMANPGGSRGVAFLVILAFLISWHALVRPIPRKIWLLLAVCGILAFNLLGAIRSYGHFPNPSELLPWLLSSGEFEHIFGNAVELLHAVQREALHIPLTIRFSELFAFVPSELLIFDKTALPDWFMDNFYPELKAAGGGLAFGVTAQAIVGHGSIEAMVRGLIFGVVLGKVYQLLYRHARHWWVFPVYIYLLTRIFDSVRSSMFSFLSDVIQSLIPLIVLLCLISSAWREIRIRSATSLAAEKTCSPGHTRIS